MHTVGVILTHGEGSETKYCVVVQRFYPQIPDIEVDVGDIRISNTDIVNGLKIFVRGKTNEDRFPPHPDLYFKRPDSYIQSFTKNSNPIFDFKIGFPKGGSEVGNSSDLKQTAKRELKEETGITLSDDKFDEARTLVIGGVEYYKCGLTAEVVTPKPERNHEHEIHSVHFLTLSELKYLQRNYRRHLSRNTYEVISILGEAEPSERTDNINKILSYRIMDDDLYQNYVQAVAHASYLRRNIPGDPALQGGGKKYRQKGGETEPEPKINHYDLYSAGQVIELFNLMLSDEEKESLDKTNKNEIRKRILSNLEKLKKMESPVEILEKALNKPQNVGGGTRKNKKSRRNNRNRNKRTKRR